MASSVSLDASRIRHAWRPIGVALAAASASVILLQSVPGLRIDLFAAGAARLAAGLLGAGLERGETAWTLVGSDRSVEVTAACSGTDFFLLVTAVIGWRLARIDRSFLSATCTALVFALPVTLFVNGLRVAAVVQAHRWLIPLLPERHSAFAHLLTGAAVFLPSLVVLNLILETYVKRRRPAACPR